NMPYHYSKSTRLFYDDEESYSDMPSDVVAVTDEQHSLLFLALKMVQLSSRTAMARLVLCLMVGMVH
uniref:hypothetical protein n=1 Tax=Asaia astilbis TaxID=610244 RepID=UPI000470EEF6